MNNIISNNIQIGIIILAGLLSLAYLAYYVKKNLINKAEPAQKCDENYPACNGCNMSINCQEKEFKTKKN